MIVRLMTEKDIAETAVLLQELWPHHSIDETKMYTEEAFASAEEEIFVCEIDLGLQGFAQVSLRHDYVEGSETSPVGYLEGIYVRESVRREGAGQQLLHACEEWARARGCKEFASDCHLDNTLSEKFHLGSGFREAEKLIHFIKEI